MWLECKKQSTFCLWGSASGSVNCCIRDVENKVGITLRRREKIKAAHVMQKGYGIYCVRIGHQDLEKI